MINVKLMKSVLKVFYSKEGPERCGFILPGDKIVEVKNIASTPDNGFQISPEDVIEYTENQKAIATWHTHPNYHSNRSGEDYRTFQIFHDLYHFIIGSDNVRCYKMNMEKKAIMEIEDAN